MDRSREEQERFCASSWPRLVAALTHYCGDLHLAEELAQEALIRACTRWAHVSRLASPVGWTYHVAVNVCNSRMRRRRAEQRAYERYGLASDCYRDADVASGVALRESLAQLTPRQREAIVLRYFLDLPANQVAELLGATPGSIRVLTHRALARLRDLLGDHAAPVEVPDVL